MLELWLMRHGEAASPEHGTTDAERQLTDRGRQQVMALARWLKQREMPLDLILHSPLRRTQQTAQAFAEEFPAAQGPTAAIVLAPGMDAQLLLSHLSRTATTRVLCVAHQPDVGRCLSALIGGAHADIAPGFCASIAFSHQLAPGLGRLRWCTEPAWFGG